MSRSADPKLDAYAELLVHRQVIERTFESERLQDALEGGAGLGAIVEMIDELHQQAAVNDLDYGQRHSLETCIVARDDILARYPDPQGILNMKAKHDQSVQALQSETLRARAAAVAEHIAAQPGWVTVVGTQPTGRKLRETWNEVVEDLAGRYVDARAEPSCSGVRDMRDRPYGRDDAHRARRRGRSSGAERVRRPRPGSTRCWPTPITRRCCRPQFDAQRAAEQIELDTRPRWLTGTLGDRPVDPRLAEQWDRLGRTMISLRDSNGITDEIDNGYSRADISCGHHRPVPHRRRPRPAAAGRGHRPRTRHRRLSAADADAAHAANTRSRASSGARVRMVSIARSTPEQQGTAAYGWICSELAASSRIRGVASAPVQREAMVIYLALCGLAPENARHG